VDPHIQSKERNSYVPTTVHNEICCRKSDLLIEVAGRELAPRPSYNLVIEDDKYDRSTFQGP
jgi:hypothetical protein